MPQIKEYLQQEQTQGAFDRPSANGANVPGGIGAAVVGAGNDLMNFAEILEKRKTQEEISDSAVNLSKLHADYTKELQDAVQRGDLDTEKFNADLKEKIDAAGENISTRGGALNYKTQAAQLQTHFYQNSIAAQAEQAALKAKSNYNVTLNQQSSALINDPSSFELAKQQHDQNLDAMVQAGNLPFEAAEKLKAAGSTELAKSSIRGWIRTSPETAQKALDGGTWDQYIDGTVKHQLYGELKVQENANRTEKLRQEEDYKRQLKEKNEAVQNDFLQKLDDHKLTTAEIMNSTLLPVEGSGSKAWFLAQIDRSATKKVKTNPAVFNDLFSRVHLPDGDPNKILSEEDINHQISAGNLSFTDGVKLRKEFQGKGTEQGQREATMFNRLISEARARLVKKDQFGLPDPDGEQHLTDFIIESKDKIAQAKKEGKSPFTLLDPKSPDSLRNNIDSHARSTQDIIQSQIQRMNSQSTPSATPLPKELQRQPGESAADYLKRTGR